MRVNFFTWKSCIFLKREEPPNLSCELWKTFWIFFSPSNKEFIKFSVPLSPCASHSQRHNIEPNHQLEQLRPLFCCKAAWKKKVPCVCSCNTFIILRNMEKFTTDFQICIFLFPIMSVRHNLHRQENVGSWLFFSFCLFSFSYRRAGTAESWDKSPTPSLVRWAQYGRWGGTQGTTTRT